MPAIVVFALGALAGSDGALRYPKADDVIATVKSGLNSVAKSCLQGRESSSASDLAGGGESK